MWSFLTNRLFLGGSAVTMAVALIVLTTMHLGTTHDLKTARADLATCAEARKTAEDSLKALADETAAKLAAQEAATKAAKAKTATLQAQANALLMDTVQPDETACDAADRLLTQALQEAPQ